MLIIWGKQDRLISSAHAAEFGRLSRNSRVEIIDEYRHVPQIEQLAIEVQSALRGSNETPRSTDLKTYLDQAFYRERTTGFEPATLTLARLAPDGAVELVQLDIDTESTW